MPKGIWDKVRQLSDSVDAQHFTPLTWVDLRTLNRLCSCSANCSSCLSFVLDESWFFLRVLTNNNRVCRYSESSLCGKKCKTKLKVLNKKYNWILRPKFTKITLR